MARIDFQTRKNLGTYNDSVYEVVDGHVQISFANAPSVKDVRMILKLDGVLLYELNAVASRK